MSAFKILAKALIAVAAAGLMTNQSIAEEITVSAATSLADALKEVVVMYQAAHPNIDVRLNFDASGVLLQQIQQGASVDLFASADLATLDHGEKLGVLDTASRTNFASNSLVLIQPKQRATTLTSLDDLDGPNIRRIAIGKSGIAPVGRYTEQALASAGLWHRLQPRYIFADSARQALEYVARGEVDAGFVYKTDAILMQDEVDVVQTATGHDPMVYAIALVADSVNNSTARTLIDFLVSSHGQDVLARHGFGLKPR